MRRVLDGLVSIPVRGVELVIALALVVVALPLWLLPWSAAMSLARIYGLVTWCGWAVGRRVAMINLRRTLGVSRSQARRMSREVVCSMLVALAEGLQFSRRWGRHRSCAWPLRDPDNWQDRCRPEDPDLLASILADPRPTIFVSGHLGSWEVGVILFSALFGDRGAVVVRQIDNPFVDALFRRMRHLEAHQWIEKRGGARDALARLRQGHSVALLLDENGGSQGVFVDFFGRPAATHKTAAQLALRTGARVVAVATRSLGRGRFGLRLCEIATVPAGAPAVDVRRLTQEITAALEQWIREDPCRWRWVHWRWRWRPEGRDERYGRRELAEAFADRPAGVRPAMREVSAAAVVRPPGAEAAGDRRP